MTYSCPPNRRGHAADTFADSLSVRLPPSIRGRRTSRTDTGTDTRPVWKQKADLKELRHLRAQIAKSPRCKVCRAPMVAGQVDTHLSCRGAS